jgi:Meckel syndrome type 1 protein
LLFQVNSVDDWGRHRIEGYGFVRMPVEPGHHQLAVPTWRPRGSLASEIHSFFLGGSVRIMKVEELVRTRHFDEHGRADIVNRFGLETEDSGTVIINLNICWQSKTYHRAQRLEHNIRKHKELLETKKRVNEFKLKQLKLLSEKAAKGDDNEER